MQEYAKQIAQPVITIFWEYLTGIPETLLEKF